MRTTVALVGIAAALALPASAAPRAEHPGECAFYWDIAITARAMAIVGVPKDTSRRVIWGIFVLDTDERVASIADSIVDAAHAAPVLAGERAGVFATMLKGACLSGGNMDGVLGVSL